MTTGEIYASTSREQTLQLEAVQTQGRQDESHQPGAQTHQRWRKTLMAYHGWPLREIDTNHQRIIMQLLRRSLMIVIKLWIRARF